MHLKSMLSKMCLQRVSSLGKGENLMQGLRTSPEAVRALPQFSAYDTEAARSGLEPGSLRSSWVECSS